MKYYSEEDMNQYSIKLKTSYNNQMHVNECHRTLLQTIRVMRFANRLLALYRFGSGTRQFVPRVMPGRSGRCKSSYGKRLQTI